MESVLRGLLLVSVPFLLESALEMYLLTAVKGPQNLFFAVGHLWPLAAMLLGLSALAGLALLVLLCGLWIARAVRGSRGEGRAPAWRYVATLALAAHFGLLATYSTWAR